MDDFARIVGVSSHFPEECVEQPRITDLINRKWQNSDVQTALIEKFHRSSRVNARHMAMAFDAYQAKTTFAERNDAYIRVGLDISEKAVTHLLSNAKVEANDIAQIIFTTVTGLAVPSMDARLMNRLPFSPNTKRVPLFGLGCVAGAAGIARAADYLKGHPDELVLLIALELCSLTFQDDDVSMANIVSSGLFGDGCAAVLLAGCRRVDTFSATAAPKIVDSCSFFFPDSERVMGFDFNEKGFKIVLSGDVPQIAQRYLPDCVNQMLSKHHLHRNDVAAWIAHPGGPRVLEALTAGLNLLPDALAFSYESLAEVGNLSSASVLLVLEKTLTHKKFRAGDYAVLLAMGPAFCAEVVLLKW